MKAKLAEFRPLFSRKFKESLPTKFSESAREFWLSQTKFRYYFGEISQPLKRDHLRETENKKTYWISGLKVVAVV